jgi:hypothetical protein
MRVVEFDRGLKGILLERVDVSDRNKDSLKLITKQSKGEMTTSGLKASNVIVLVVI